MRKGFTLIELIIALAISSIIAVGLFTVITSVASIRDSSVIASENIIMTEKLTILFNRDSRMMRGSSYSVDSIDTIRKLKFITDNSLRFNKAMPVDVTYYVKDNYLIRREINTTILYDMQMKLIPNVTDMKIQFFDGNEYKDELVASSKMIKLTITVNGKPITIITGSING